MSISGALALLNLAPTYYLDGEHAMRYFVDWLLPRMSEGQKDFVVNMTFRFVAVLFVANIAVSVGALVFS